MIDNWINVKEEIDNLESISSSLKASGFYLKKSFGQNFIFDLNLTAKISKQANISHDDLILEIGPGAGSLTREILKYNPYKMVAVEADENCLKLLEPLQNIVNKYDSSKFSIELCNALNFSVKDLSIKHGRKVKIIANLPYNVGTELFLNFLDDAQYIESMTLMFQKEVAQRITATTGDEHYGRLAVISNLTCINNIEFIVPPTAFFPPPKVYSAILSSYPRAVEEREIFDKAKIKNLTRAAFSQKRKKLRNNLKGFFQNDIDDIFSELNFSQNIRAEELSPQDFLSLSRF